MKRIVLAAFCAIIILSGCATTPSNMTASDVNEAMYTLNYNQGLNRLTANEPSFAMEEFLNAEKYKKTPDLYYSMGQACYMLKRNELALKYFDKSLALDKSFSSSYVGKGIVLREMGRYDEALTQFNAALDNILFHEPDKAYYNIALTYLAMKDRDNAIKYLKETVGLRPDFIPSYYQLALVYIEQRNYEPAIDALKVLLSYAPDSPEAHLLLGKTYLKVARSTAAEIEFREVIRLAPQSEYAREATIYLTGGRN
jgi:tetratricopeptide (TPR) repeat protein